MVEHNISNGEYRNDILLANNINSVIGGDPTTGLYHYESVSVSNGETANNTTINPGGHLTIFCGGNANNTTVNDMGYLIISSGGTADNTTINRSGYVEVSSGGTANSTMINPDGSLYVSSGGTANSTTVYSDGWFYIEKGGIADNTMIDSGGFMRIRSGGTANSTTVNSGRLELYSGGTAYNTVVNSGGGMSIYYDCDVANGTVVNSGGIVYLFSSGTANSTTVNMGGKFIVSSGGTATMIVENGGFFSSLPGANTTFVPNTFSDLTLNNGISATAHSGTTANGIKVNSGGVLFVFDGGSANSTTVNYSGLLYIDGSGTVNDTIINSGGYLYVISDGTVKGITASQGATAILSSGGQLEQSFNCEGQMAIYPGATARIYSASTLTGESALFANWGTIDFLVASASVDGAPLINDYTKISGYGSYTITVNGDMQAGDYLLIGNAADFANGITFIAEDTYSTGWSQWNRYTGYNTVTLDDREYTLKHDEENNLVLSVAASQLNTILDFDDLKAQVSKDWKKYKVQVKLDRFNDTFKGGWGKETNHRPYYSVAVTDLAFNAEGSTNHIDITCNGHLNGTIGILSVDADLSENLTVGDANEKAGLFLSLDKSKQNGDWEWGDWDLVGKFTVKLQQVDHRFKFHLSETVYDPKTITGTAEIDTKNKIYTIKGVWKASKYKGPNQASVVVTLKDCFTPDDPKSGLELSSISISFSAARDRQDLDPKLKLYLIEGHCTNLASCDTGPMGFGGKIGFSWNEYTFRIKHKWQKDILSKVSIEEVDYYPQGTLTVSAVDTLLTVDMNLDGDFEATGEVRFLNVISKSEFAPTLSVAWIAGKVNYYASNESLTVIGNVGIAGIADMTGFVWSINDSLRLSAQGSFSVPGWMEFLTGFSTLSGYLELISTSRSTCIAVWGKADKNDGRSYYKGYQYNLTTGDIKNISNREDVLATYDDLISELEMGRTGSALYEIYRKKYERIKGLYLNGSYLGASDNLQICAINETTGTQVKWCLGDFSDNTKETTSGARTALRSADGKSAGVRGLEVDGTGISRGESDSEEETLQVYVEYFDEGGFSIRLEGEQELLFGDWRIEICDDGADLKDLEVSLQCEESPYCQLGAFSIAGMGSTSISIDYSISGADDEVDISVNCIKHDGESTQTVCAGFLDAEEKHADIDTTVVANSGFYELYLHVTGDFIPMDSKSIGVFSIAKRTASDGAILKDLTDISAMEFWMIVSSSQDSGTYTIANSADGFNKAFTFTTDAGDIIGTISIGETFSVGSTDYMLNLTDSTLSVTIKKTNKLNPDNKPDNGTNNYLWTKKLGWNTDEHIAAFQSNTITGNGEINMDETGSIDLNGKHNMFGNDGTNKDTGDVAKISAGTAAKLTFTVDSNAAGTFYVYEDDFDKKGNRKQITVGKVTVKAGQVATLKDVCLTATGKYYVAMTAKNVKKAGTEGLYNVSVTEHKFFVDADEGDNKTAGVGKTISVGRGLDMNLVLDNAPMVDITGFGSFVGFTDSDDYAKLDLASSAYLKFSITGNGDGKAKFTIWKRAKGTTGKLSKVTGVSLPAKKVYAATTKAQFLDTDKYEYYVLMECTDASKGKGVYYNVQVTDDTVFFDSADNGFNNALYNKKGKAFYAEDATHHFETTTVNGAGIHVKLDSDPVGDANYENFVGYQDAADFAKIELASDGNLSFDLKATGNATFVVYKKGQDKKGNDTLEAIQTTKLTVAKDKDIVETGTELLTGLKAGEYYVSMTAKSTKANASGSVFYSVMATLDSSVSSALSMPETDSLGISDALSFGQYDADVLADASVSSLAELDDKSGWMNISMLA